MDPSHFDQAKHLTLLFNLILQTHPRPFQPLCIHTRYLQPPLTEKGLYFRFRDPENRTRARKLSTRRAPLATSFCENRTPGSENPTLPMAGSCSRSAGLRGG